LNADVFKDLVVWEALHSQSGRIHPRKKISWTQRRRWHRLRQRVTYFGPLRM